jgi:hypothetical protein
MMTRRMPVGGRYQSLKLTIRPARPVGSARLIRRRLHRRFMRNRPPARPAVAP